MVNPGKARPGAPTLDLYEDFQCPICGQLEKLFGAQIRSLAAAGASSWSPTPCRFLDDNLHNDSSLRAANAAACAADAGRFGPYHDAVFAGQPAKEGQGYTDAQLEGFAKTAGITGSAFSTWQQCVKSGQHTAYAKAVQTQSEKDGVFGTPTLKLNGKVLDLQKLTPAVPHRTGQGRDEVSALTAMTRGSPCRPRSPAPTAGRLVPRPLPDPRLRDVHPGRHRPRGLDHRAAPGRPRRRAGGGRSTSRRRPCPFGIVGGRLYHVITTPQPYFGEGGHPLNAFKIWQGGLGIWGAVALGALGAWIGCRRRGVPFLRFADCAAPGIAVAQALGRWGNWFNNELYGAPHQPAVGPDRSTSGTRRRATRSGTRTVRPSSSAPSSRPSSTSRSGACCWPLATGRVADRRFALRRGQVFALYVMLATPSGRVVIEMLRTDEANHILGLRLNVWTSVHRRSSVALYGFWRAGRRALPGDVGHESTDDTAAPASQ